MNREKEEERVREREREMEEYFKKVKKWRKRVRRNLFIMPILFLWGIIDILFYIKTGQSLINPFYDFMVILCAGGLFFTALAAKKSDKY